MGMIKMMSSLIRVIPVIVYMRTAMVILIGLIVAVVATMMVIVVTHFF